MRRRQNQMEMTRRRLITLTGTLITAPAIIPFTSLMKPTPFPHRYLLHLGYSYLDGKGKGMIFDQVESRKPIPNIGDPFRKTLADQALNLLPKGHLLAKQATVTSYGWQLINGWHQNVVHFQGERKRFDYISRDS
jgi:hypothetical protein